MNPANAPKCEMVLSDRGDDLDGMFTCNGLEGPGSESLNVLAGSFRCVVD